MTTPTASATRPASDAQFAFIKTLIAERQLTEDNERNIQVCRTLWKLNRFTAAKASALITELKDRPLKASASDAHTAAWPKVAEGYYALAHVPGYSNAVNFFFVTENKGRTFVKHFVSDAKMPVRGQGARKILELIALNPHAAQMLYSQHTTRCYVCGRKLTDDESRALGIGPTCRGKGA